MVCTSCGTGNDAGRKFCKECAAGLARTCGTCGSTNAADAKFCGECAAPLGDTVAASGTPGSRPTTPGSRPTSPSTSLAERRLVSVLFADLVGFTPFAEERDAEEVRETLSRYFELAREVIERYGGTVEKFIGDAVMAVWGAPVAHEDDAERAVRAALDLVESVGVVAAGISARAAVLTGEAAVTVGATDQGMVAGDLVNTAARLQGVAEAGTVLVGGATYRAASRAIVFEPAGEHRLKGKDAPVAAHRAMRVVAEVGGRNRAEVLEAPFVGRAEELRLLKELFHGTARESRSRLVSIVGPAGIGKSRLAWEFAKYVDGLVESVWWHAGRSPAYGEGVTFWALGEMVRERAGLAENDDEATTRERIAATVGEWVPEPDERRWIEDALLALLGLGSDRVASEQLFAAWRTFFERIAARGPVVLLFEELHWADSGLLDFIDHLLEWSRDTALYVITLARPELLERRPDWATRVRRFSSIVLEPLQPGDMRAVLAGLVPGLPETAAQAVVARAEGFPLYAVETVRMLLAEGRLARNAEGGYEPVGDLRTLAVPDTLTALIAARLDGLESAERSLIADAAVLGQSFTRAALAAVSGTEEEALEPRLRLLVRRELLSQTDDPRSPERGQYAFVQALIREVAYQTLGRRERRTRHLAAARYFEAFGQDELAGALAGHYLAAHAHSSPGPEGDAVAIQARIALRAAAERASALAAHSQAVSLSEQALTVTTDPTEEAELLQVAGEAASKAGRHDQAETLLRRAVERRRELGDRPALAGAIAALAGALQHAYRMEKMRDVLDPASVEFPDLGEDPAVIRLWSRLAAARMDAEATLGLADRVLAAAERGDLVESIAYSLITRGSVLTNLGRSYEGMGCLRTGLELARKHGFALVAMRAENNMLVDLNRRDPRQAMQLARTALETAKALALPSYLSGILGNSADASYWSGDWEWTESEGVAALPSLPTSGETPQLQH